MHSLLIRDQARGGGGVGGGGDRMEMQHFGFFPVLLHYTTLHYTTLHYLSYPFEILVSAIPGASCGWAGYKAPLRPQGQ